MLERIQNGQGVRVAGPMAGLAGALCGQETRSIMVPLTTKAAKSLKKRSTKAEHGTSVGIAVERIRDLIVHAKLAPGTWIVEGDL